MPHQREFKGIGVAEKLKRKIIHPDADGTAAFDPCPGVSVMKIVVRGNAKSFDAPDFSRHTHGLGGPDILKKLIKIAAGAFIVVGTRTHFHPARKGMAAKPMHLRSQAHGFLPADLLASLRFCAHCMVVVAGGAIIEVCAALELYRPGLHPQARPLGFGLLVRFHKPLLASQYGGKTFAGNVSFLDLAISGAVSDPASPSFFVLLGHGQSPVFGR